MKKILTFSLLLVLISAAASAQVGQDSRFRKRPVQRGFSNGQFTRPERFELRKDHFRYNLMQRKAHRDGIVTPFERRRLYMIRQHNRRDLFRFRHNRFRRVI